MQTVWFNVTIFWLCNSTFINSLFSILILSWWYLKYGTKLISSRYMYYWSWMILTWFAFLASSIRFAIYMTTRREVHFTEKYDFINSHRCLTFGKICLTFYSLKKMCFLFPIIVGPTWESLPLIFKIVLT